jgi:hypothetical protein
MARSSPRNVNEADTVGPGVRDARRKALSPPSGVRSRQDLLQPQVGGQVGAMGYVPPRPVFDSEPQRTEIKAPDPSLLAFSRGKAQRARLRSFAWFLCGAFVGAVAVWGQTRDIPSDVYRARAWAASSLRALHMRGREDAVQAPAVPSPAPAAAVGPLASTPVPTVDVSTLPRVSDSTPRPSPVAPAVQPGAPTLAHAPGPR